MGNILNKFLESLNLKDQEKNEEEMRITLRPSNDSDLSVSSTFINMVEINSETLKTLGDLFNYKSLKRKIPSKLILNENFNFSFP